MYNTPEYQCDLFLADYPDGKVIVERYLALLDSPEYLTATGRERLTTPPLSDRLPRAKKESRPLPDNLMVAGRRITPLIEYKIRAALAVCPSVVGLALKLTVRQLFSDMKSIGYRWDAKLEQWHIS